MNVPRPTRGKYSFIAVSQRHCKRRPSTPQPRQGCSSEPMKTSADSRPAGRASKKARAREFRSIELRNPPLMPDATTWQFTGVVRLTKIGVSFVVFTVFAGFAAINTGNNALYIALSLMLAALVLSGMASKGGLKHLRVEFESVEEAWAGRAAAGRLRGANRPRLRGGRDLILTSGHLAAPA